MYHGKKKDIEKKEDNEMRNNIKALYSKSINNEVAQELVKVLPEDYFAQNILKSNLDLEDSLKTNLKSLYANPKSYSAWYHRIYVLTNSKISVGILEKEYELVNLCLDLDSRNFHCWNYKRFLDNLANKNGYKELKHYRNDISETIFAKDFSNFSAAHDMLVNGGQFDNLISQLYTDPLDISTWTVYNILQCRKAYNKNNFYVKVYSDKFVICFSSLPDRLDITLNGAKLDSDIYFKNTVYDIKLKNTDVLCVNDVIANFNIKVVLYDNFIDEILELEDRCIFGYIEKLIYTESISEREEIVILLGKADPMRRGYYKSLVQQCYHIVA